jgi:hypothetical protein
MSSVVRLAMRATLACATFIVLSTGTVIAGGADEACQQFDDQIERLELSAAATTLKAAFATAPNDYEVLYRMARLHVLLGNEETNKDKQLALYEKGVDYGTKAIGANGKGMGGYVYRAAANGKMPCLRASLALAPW